jgi:type II secretory pathway pseudopilin PulG
MTLLEMVVSLSIAAILLAITVPSVAALRDGAAARSAALEVQSLLSAARQTARARSTSATLEVDTVRKRVTVRVGTDTIRDRRLGDSYGIELHASRMAVTYAGSGLGFGAANTTIVVSRGAAAETVTVSRLGRVRR